MTVRVHPALEPLSVPIETLVADPRNARAHGKRSIEGIVASYREHGQLKPIVATRSDRVVRAGNGQLAAAKSLGWTSIAVVFVDGDERSAIRFALQDNRTAELSDWDFDGLASVLQGLDASADGVLGLGWSPDELAPFLEGMFDPAAVAASHDIGVGSEFGAQSRRTAIFNVEQWKILEPKLDPAVLKKSGLGSAIVDAVERLSRD